MRLGFKELGECENVMFAVKRFSKECMKNRIIRSDSEN